MNAQPDNLIEVRNMNFTRGSRKIFSQINLDVPRGKVTAIMGPSGIGKTTLLRLMGDKFCLIVVIFGLMVTIFLSYHALLYISQEKNEYAFSIRRPFY